MPTPLTVTLTATGSPTGGTLAAVAGGGSGAYAYRWTCPGRFAFAGQGTASCTLTAFNETGIGPFTATVVVTDTGTGATASESASFTVAQVATSVRVTPSPAAVVVGVATQFAASLFDQFGHEMDGGSFTWSASAGAVTTGGVYTAAAAGTATLTATSGSMSGIAVVAAFAASATSISVAWPAQLLPVVSQTVTIAYAGPVPPTPAVTATHGTLTGAQCSAGNMLSFTFAPAAGATSAMFTDVTTGATTTVSVGASAVPIRTLLFGLVYKGVPPGTVILADVPGGCQFRSPKWTGNGATVLRLDTGESVGPPAGTPFIRTSAGRYSYSIPDVAPAAVYRYFYEYQNEDGTTSLDEFFAEPTGTPSPPPSGGLTPQQSAQLAALLAAVSQLGGGQIQYTGPVAMDGRTAWIVQGDDAVLQWTVRNYTGPTIDGAAFTFGLMLACDYDLNPAATAVLTTAATAAAATATDGSTTVTYTVSLTAAQTSALPSTPTDKPLNMVGQLVATSNGARKTAVLASVTVSRRVV